MNNQQGGASDFEAAFEASQSGRGARLDEVEQLKRFADYASSQACIVCNVETYEVRDDLEVPRTDFGVYRGGHEDYDRPRGEWAANCERDLREILEAIEKEGVRCVFQVWIDHPDAA